MKDRRPPPLASRLLTRLLPDDQEQEILGDLEERFQHRARRHGPRAAARWYRGQALTIPSWVWWGRRGEIMHDAWSDLRHALRGLAKAPGFTTTTVLTLALAIGANAAIFSVVHGTLLQPLPYAEPARLVTIGHTTHGGDLPPQLPSSTAANVVYSRDSRSFTAQALYNTGEVTLGGERPARAAAVWSTASLFAVLGVSPALGRGFHGAEDRPGAPRVVVLGHDLWQQRFGGDPRVLGRTLTLDGVPSEIVGVMPAGFYFPVRGVDLWLPLRLDPADLGGFNTPSVARLRPGVDFASAQRELALLLPRITTVVGFITPEILRSSGLAPDVHPYLDDVVGDVRSALWVLMGMVGFVLAIACANVANLLLVRAEARQKEVVVRRALGANRWRLVSQLLAESAALAAAGGALGLALAAVALRLARTLGSRALPRIEEVRIDGTVLAFTAAVAALVAMVFALIPAVRQRRRPLVGSLRDGARGSTVGRGARRVQQTLVVSQVALALVLLVGSGLMIRSFSALQEVDPGFRAADVLTFQISLPAATYADAEKVADFHRRAMEEIAALPGAEEVGATNLLPLAGFSPLGDPLSVRGRPLRSGEIPPAIEMRSATPGYFGAMGIPLRSGRLLDTADSTRRTGAVVISETVARKFFPAGDALGQRIAHGLQQEGSGREWSEVVGVVGDVHSVALTAAPLGTVYYPPLCAKGVEMEWLSRDLWYVVRATVPPASLLPPIRDRIGRLDSTLPVADPRPLQTVIERAEAQMAFTLVMLLLAAGLGLVLGAVGLYGVVSYLTAQRRREIGLRMALGAQARGVQGMVVREALRVIATGLLVGLVVAFALSRFVGALLYAVSATDPLTYAGVTVVLLAVGLLAAWLPARRASAVSPILALRGD